MKLLIFLGLPGHQNPIEINAQPFCTLWSECKKKIEINYFDRRQTLQIHNQRRDTQN
jgi:hypothetical protein